MIKKFIKLSGVKIEKENSYSWMWKKFSNIVKQLKNTRIKKN